MTVSENICPICKTTNEFESIVCGHCGSALDRPLTEAGLKKNTTDMQALTPEMIRDWSLKEAKEVVVPESGIAFYVDGHPNPASMDSKGDFVLGRKSEPTSERLLDLSPYGAYSMGLSRRHLYVRRGDDGYELLDLGSVNGSWLNEERLVPHKTYEMPSGSQLRLGRMRVLVLYSPFAETK
jgi:hypothetical protein